MSESIVNRKRVLITGASSGIGAAVAARLARDGWSTVLLGRDADRLRHVAASLPDTADAAWFACDFSASTLERELHRICSHLPRLDALIHAAGMIANGSLLSSGNSCLDELIQVNVRAPLLLTQHCLPLLELTAGIIVFVNSSGVLRPQPMAGEYIASKHALRAVTDSLREEINGRGVRVTSIYPGRTATPMQARVHSAEGKPYHPQFLMQPEDVAAVVACAVSMSNTSELVDLFMRPLRPPQRAAPRETGAHRRTSAARKPTAPRKSAARRKSRK